MAIRVTVWDGPMPTASAFQRGFIGFRFGMRPTRPMRKHRPPSMRVSAKFGRAMTGSYLPCPAELKCHFPRLQACALGFSRAASPRG